jgi:hypothetical protein
LKEDESMFDPLVATLAMIGAVQVFVWAIGAGRSLLAALRAVRMWWRWRRIMARPYRVEVNA